VMERGGKTEYLFAMEAAHGGACSAPLRRRRECKPDTRAMWEGTKQA
jgi:hypothetical protein